MAVLAAVIAHHVRWIRARQEFLSKPGVFDFTAIAPPSVGRYRRAPGLLWMLGERGVSGLGIPDGRSEFANRANELFPEAVIGVAPQEFDDR